MPVAAGECLAEAPHQVDGPISPRCRQPSAMVSAIPYSSSISWALRALALIADPHAPIKRPNNASDTPALPESRLTGEARSAPEPHREAAVVCRCDDIRHVPELLWAAIHSGACGSLRVEPAQFA